MAHHHPFSEWFQGGGAAAAALTAIGAMLLVGGGIAFGVHEIFFKSHN